GLDQAGCQLVPGAVRVLSRQRHEWDQLLAAQLLVGRRVHVGTAGHVVALADQIARLHHNPRHTGVLTKQPDHTGGVKELLVVQIHQHGETLNSKLLKEHDLYVEANARVGSLGHNLRSRLLAGRVYTAHHGRHAKSVFHVSFNDVALNVSGGGNIGKRNLRHVIRLVHIDNPVRLADKLRLVNVGSTPHLPHAV